MPRHPNGQAGPSDDPNDKELGAPPLEEEPVPSDILPDQIEGQRGKPPEEDEREITARPKEDFHPLSPDELP